MRRLTVGVGTCLLVLLLATAASASCVALPGQRSDRLRQIAAGHVDADVAFIGRVVERTDVTRHGLTRQAVVFQVIATFAGEPLRQRTVFLGGSCDRKGRCVEGGEDQHYRGHRVQLVLADRQRGIGLVSQSVCSETGSLTAGEVDLMVRSSTLPFTGWQLMPFVSGGSAAIVLGVLLTSLSRRRSPSGSTGHFDGR